MGIKLGLLGLGSFGSAFAPLFASHPKVDSVCLCDAEASRIKRWAENKIVSRKLAKDGCFESFDDLCASDCDAIAIITQPWLHAPQAIQAMEAGKHVYSAVPVICLPDDDEMLEWCQKIIDTSLRTGRHYMLGETTWYRPQTMFCRRKFLEGAFGKPVYAAAEYAHDVDSFSCSLRQVRISRSTGAIGAQAAAFYEKYRARGLKDHPMSYPTHSVSGPLRVMGTRAVKVSAYGVSNQFGAADDYFANTDFASIVALFRLANGVPMRDAELREICSNTGLAGEDFRLFGTRGRYSYGTWNDNGRVAATTDPKKVESTKLTDAEMRDPLPADYLAAYNELAGPADGTAGDFIPSGHGGSHPYLVDEFVSSIAAGRRPAIDIWKAASYMAMGVAAHKSAQRDGEIVPVVDFGDPPAN